MSTTTHSTRNQPAPGAGNANQPRIFGYYNINDVKYDILKIIAPFDGYMYNDNDVTRVTSMFSSYLGDLKRSYRLFSYYINVTEKNNAYTFDIEIKMHRERSPKKLKIHVGRLPAVDKGWDYLYTTGKK